MTSRRIIERQESDGMFTKINHADLKIGDRFRMFEPDGVPVADKAGGTVWTCDSAPFVVGEDEEGPILGVDIKENV